MTKIGNLFRLPRLLRRLRGDESGVALTEFAYTLPVLLTLIFGGLETANLALSHLRVSQIAMTVADNAGRVDTVMDESNIYEVFGGADLIGGSIDFEENGQIVLSSLEDNGRNGSNAGQTIGWQRCWGTGNIGSYYAGEGDGADDDSLADGLGPEGSEIAAASGTAVMFVEATYDYQPLIAANILGSRTIRYESAFNVRERVNQSITNTQGLAVNSCGEPNPECGDQNNGHGNDEDGVDDCNPGNGGSSSGS